MQKSPAKSLKEGKTSTVPFNEIYFLLSVWLVAAEPQPQPAQSAQFPEAQAELFPSDLYPRQIKYPAAAAPINPTKIVSISSTSILLKVFIIYIFYFTRSFVFVNPSGQKLSSATMQRLLPINSHEVTE
jgi:hypothetical protein